MIHTFEDSWKSLLNSIKFLLWLMLITRLHFPVIQCWRGRRRQARTWRSSPSSLLNMMVWTMCQEKSAKMEECLNMQPTAEFLLIILHSLMRHRLMITSHGLLSRQRTSNTMFRLLMSYLQKMGRLKTHRIVLTSRH